MTRILIADALAPAGAASLRSCEAVEVTEQTGLVGDDLVAALKDHDGVVVRSAVQLTGEILDAAAGGRLRGIARAGVGVDNIDLEAATRHGIAVMNSASASTITTAEHAFALMIALARNIGPAHARMAGGGWDRKKFTGTQLHGKTLGVVGLGRIGRTMAERALAFGMSVIAFDPVVNAETALDGRVRLVPTFDELIGDVDIVSFHVPKTETTAGMLDADAFAKARDGLLVVNAARGGVVDEAAIVEALESGRCGGAALDVYTSEPPPEDSPLRNHPKILTTPHLGASTSEAQEAVAVDACQALATYLRGEGLHGAVNVGGLELDLSDRQRSFVDLARRMSMLLDAAQPDMHLEHVRFSVRGADLASRAGTIARLALADLLNHRLTQVVNLVNVLDVAEERGIGFETVIEGEHGDDRVSIEVTSRGDTHRVEGAIYEDGRPRITHLDGFAMDMVPAGHMVLLRNADQPGRIGAVGTILGNADVNVAAMTIGRESARDGEAMMILEVDDAPASTVLEGLRNENGIRSVTVVELGAV